MSLKILIIAAESSGDKLGANLIDGILSEYNEKKQVVFQGIGGPLMKSRGVVSFYDFNDFSQLLNYILENTAQIFEMYYADINHDDSIDIFDLIIFFESI